MASRGPYRKSAQRREDILSAAFEVFSTQGFDATSVNEIARTAGMTPPGLMHHFDGKADLLLAVLERRDAAAAERLAGRRNIEVLRAFVEIAAENQSKREVIQLYTVLAAEASRPDHPARAFFTERFRRIVAETTTALEETSELGMLRPDVDPRQAAIDLIAHVEGLQLLWLDGVDDIDMAERVRGYIARLLTVPL